MKRSFIGNISETGRLSIIERDDMNHFIKCSKGREMILTIDVSSDSKFTLIEYFFKSVVPKCMEGFNNNGHNLNENQTIKKLLSIFNMYDGDHQKKLMDIEQLTQNQLFDFIDNVKHLAIVELGVWIDDPINHC